MTRRLAGIMIAVLSIGGFGCERASGRFVAGQDDLYVLCGDRHWQYWSVHPELGIHELGCGPINDQHKYGGNPGEDAKYHRYFSKKGGLHNLRNPDFKFTIDKLVSQSSQ